MSQITRRGSRRSRLCATATIVALAGAGALPALAQGNHDLVPLREAYSSTVRDSFYSIYRKQHLQATQLGMIDRGVMAWVPCSRPNVPGPFGEPPVITPGDNNLGYGSMADMPMDFACAQPAGAKPLYRLYKGAPATDHLYTTDTVSVDSFKRLGWSFERVEGYLFATQVPNSLPVYRFSRCRGDEATCNWEHRLVLGDRGRDALLHDNWTLDALEGYAFASDPRTMATVRLDGTFNGQFSNGGPQWIYDARTPKIGFELSGSGRSKVMGMVLSNATVRPPQATRQRIVFNLNTGTLFEPGSNLDHIPVIARFHAQLGSDGLPTSPIDGIGIAIAPSNWAPCGLPAGGGQIFVKLVGNEQSLVPNAGHYAYDCAARLPEPLQSGTSYRITLTVDDHSRLNLRVERDGQVIHQYEHAYAHMYPTCPVSPTGPIDDRNSHCGNALPMLAFPGKRSGYAVLPVFKPAAVTGSRPARGTLGPLYMQWIDDADFVWRQL